MPKIQKKPNEQYVVTVDKGLAEAMGLEGGEKTEWSVESRNKLSLKIVGDSDE